MDFTQELLSFTEHLANHLPGGFFFYHAYGDQKLIGFNKKLCEIFGCANEQEFRQLTGNSFKGIVHPDEYEEVENNIRRQIASSSDNIDHVTYHFIRKDGTVGMLDDYGHFSNSETYGEIYYVFVQDISKQHEEELERARIKRKEREDLLMSLSGSESTYIINPRTDSFTLVGNKNLLQKYFRPEAPFSESIIKYIAKDIYEPDRKKAGEMMLPKNIMPCLEKKNKFSFTYRHISQGVPRWYEMKVARLSEDEMVCSFSDIDTAVTDKMIYKKLQDNYFGIYCINLFSGICRILKTGHPEITGSAGLEKTYEEVLDSIASVTEDNSVDFFKRIASIEYLKERFREDDVAYYNYRSYAFEGERWVTVTGKVLSRAADGTPELFALGFALLDEKFSAAQNRLQTDMQMISGLASEYHALYYFNISENIFKVYSLDANRFPVAADIVAGGDDPIATLRRFGASEVVHPDDRQIFSGIDVHYIKDHLAHAKRHSVRFRRLFEGEYRWTEMDMIKYEEADDPANAVVIGFAERDATIRAEQSIGNAYRIFAKDCPSDEAIAELLSTVGEFYDGERCYIFEKDKDDTVLNNTYEWCAPGVEPMIDRLQDVPVEVCAGWFREFSRRGAFYMDALDSEHNTPETVELLQMQGIESLVAAPLISGDRVVGFIGVDNPRKAKKEITVMRNIAAVVYGEILKRQELLREVGSVQEVANRKLAEANRKLEAALLRDKLIHNFVKARKWSYAISPDCEVVSAKYDDEVEQVAGIYENDAPMKWLERVHPEDREASLMKFRAAISDCSGNTPYEVSYRLKMSDNVYRWMKTSGRRVNYDDGSAELFGITVNIHEQIEEQERQKEQLSQALSMAESANRAKTTFLNNMSHDIRTPMNAIIGFTGLAASHIENQQQVQDYLNKIAQSSDHLLSLINDVLDMSRIESGKMNLEEKPENLSEIIHTLRDIVLSDIHAKHHDFFIDTVNVKDERVVCDKLRLNQVLLNILSNSIKYTPTGGTISMRITETAVKPSGYGTYEFRIKDNGIGMSEAYLKTIFDPFSRASSSTASGIQGTGLGMSITKNIVDMMGGRIEVESKPGKGTETVVTLDFKLTGIQNEDFSMPELEGMRALVADDDPHTCVSIGKMLKEIGMRSEWCTSGKEAVFRANDAHMSGDWFKVYIIDWLMPDMNGIETVRRIRAVIGDDAPIIILTAYDWSDIEDEARQAGVTAFVSKPMFPSDLKRVLGSCMGGKAEDNLASSSHKSFEGKKILLVEDNELNREIALEILKEHGFSVSTADDGSVAVEMMASAGPGDYDLILMDIQMPTIDGYEATRQIRALDSPVAGIPILAMTANAFAEDRKAAIDAGMNAHVSKPIDIDNLIDTIASFI